MASRKRRVPGAADATGLRQGLANYGDAGFSLFLRKAFIKAGGYSDDALDRPIVGITNTFSDYNPCHGNVPDLIEAVKRGVMLAGALPMVFPTVSIHESFSHPTSMFLRNLMSIDTEEMIRAQPMDSVVLIGGCDKTLPAQLMAAASADRPAVVLPVGPMLVGHFKGEVLGACTDCRRLWGQYRAGTFSEADIERVSERLAPTKGTCMVMGTASTMGCIVETLGMGLPGSGSIPGDALGPTAGRRSQRQARCRDGQEAGPASQRDHDQGGVPQRAHRAAGDRRVDQRAGASHRRGAPARHRDRPRGVRRNRPQGAGAGRPQALGRSLHGAFPLGRRQLAPDARDPRPSRREVPHGRGPHLEAGDRRRRDRAQPDRHPHVGESDQANRRHGRAARQPCAARRRDQACGRLARAADAHRPRRRLRFAGGSRGARRRSGARRDGRRHPGVAQRRSQGRSRHARSRLLPHPDEARARGRQGHDPHLRRAHERHGLRHHRAARGARGGGRRPARPGQDRRSHQPRRAQAQARAPGERQGARGTPQGVEGAHAARRQRPRLRRPLPEGSACRPTKASISTSSARQNRERGEAPGHFRRRHVLQLS